MARDPELIAHQEWLGYLQPVGLVVSPPALAAAGAYPNKNIIPDHARFLDLVEQVTIEGEDDPQPVIRDFPRFATQILGWEPADLLGSPDGEPVPETLEVALPEYNETLRPSYAVPEFDKTTDGDRKWLMMIHRVKLGLDLDDTPPRPTPRTNAGRPAPRLALSGSCARLRFRLACSRTARTCGSSTLPGARLRGT